MKDGMLTNADCERRAAQIAHNLTPMFSATHKIKLFGVPRGGVPAAYLVARALGAKGAVVDTPEDAHVFIDDIVDSGATRKRYLVRYPHRPFVALFDKGAAEEEARGRGGWLVFPWEQSAETSALDIPTRLLQFVGEDVAREGLRETPARFLKAWRDYTVGYKQDPRAVLKTFEDGAERYDELVMVRDIPVYSHCEHHLAPFFGRAAVAYIPSGRVLGLSKLARVVEGYMRRLQVQERLTQQIANAISDELGARGVGVVLECRHMCMEARGVRSAGTVTSTSCLLGVLKTDTAARAEFLQLLR